MGTNIIKAKILTISFLMITISSFSQYTTLVSIGELENSKLKEKIESNTSHLLSELNTAYFEERLPILKNIEMTEDARSAVLSMWETSPYRCKGTEIIDHIIKLLRGGLELRNIPLFMKNADSTERNQEGAIVYTEDGTIDNLYLTVDQNQWKYIVAEGDSVKDFRKREFIKDFVENFRTAYNRKDIDFLDKVFSDDALIITGKVIRVYQSDNNYIDRNLPREKVIYIKQKKSEYIANLQKYFLLKSYVNIKFDEVEVMKHPKVIDYYGVTVKQHWSATGYSDVGYIFLLIDLRDEEKPIIHVRTWQPSSINGRELDRNEVFNVGSFGDLQ